MNEIQRLEAAVNECFRDLDMASELGSEIPRTMEVCVDDLASLLENTRTLRDTLKMFADRLQAFEVTVHVYANGPNDPEARHARLGYRGEFSAGEMTDARALIRQVGDN